MAAKTSHFILAIARVSRVSRDLRTLYKYFIACNFTQDPIPKIIFIVLKFYDIATQVLLVSRRQANSAQAH